MYQKLVRTMSYLYHKRSKSVYAINVISQFMHNPEEVHLQIDFRVLQYLRGSLGKGIILRKNDKLLLKVYTDIDYVRSIVDKISIIGY